MKGLRVLLTNFSLRARGGTALYLRDVALGLLRRGHKPVAYSTDLGSAASELRELTIPVIDDLEKLGEEPDIIHGQNNYELMTALLHFPKIPALSFCHGWLSWQNAPPVFARVLRHVAVDEVCRDRLIYEHCVPSDRITLLLNFVDLDRFKARGPLPAVPRRALVFSNGVAEGSGLEFIREACSRAGLDLDVAGASNGSAIMRPEDILPRYDLVFGKARCALEAMATGSAVIVCDVRGLASMVTSENLERLRGLNFGVRTLSRPLDPTALYEDIRKYSAEDAMRVSSAIRRTASLDGALDELIHLYEVIISEFAEMPTVEMAHEMKAAAAYLRKLSPHVGAAGIGEQPMRRSAEPAGVLNALSDEMVLTLLAELSLNALQPAAGRITKPAEARQRVLGITIGSSSQSLTITTPRAPWQYAATMRLLDAVPEDLKGRAGVLRVRLHVREGAIGVGVLNASGTDFLARQPLSPSRDYVDVFLRLARLGDATDLVLQSWDRGVESRVLIEAVTLYAAGIN